MKHWLGNDTDPTKAATTTAAPAPGSAGAGAGGKRKAPKQPDAAGRADGEKRSKAGARRGSKEAGARK